MMLDIFNFKKMKQVRKKLKKIKKKFKLHQVIFIIKKNKKEMRTLCKIKE